MRRLVLDGCGRSAGRRSRNTRNDGVVSILLVGLRMGALVLSVALGSVPLPLNRVLGALAFQSSQGDQLVIWQIRLPRALAAALRRRGAGDERGCSSGLAAKSVGRAWHTRRLGDRRAIRDLRALFWSRDCRRADFAAGGGRWRADRHVAGCAAAWRETSSVVTLILIGVGLFELLGGDHGVIDEFGAQSLQPCGHGQLDARHGGQSQLRRPDLCAALHGDRGGGASASTRAVRACPWRRGGRRNGLGPQAQRLAVIIGAGLATGAAVALAGAIGFVGIVTASGAALPPLRSRAATGALRSARGSDPYAAGYRRAGSADR